MSEAAGTRRSPHARRAPRAPTLILFGYVAQQAVGADAVALFVDGSDCGAARGEGGAPASCHVWFFGVAWRCFSSTRPTGWGSPGGAARSPWTRQNIARSQIAARWLPQLLSSSRRHTHALATRAAAGSACKPADARQVEQRCASSSLRRASSSAPPRAQRAEQSSQYYSPRARQKLPEVSDHSGTRGRPRRGWAFPAASGHSTTACGVRCEAAAGPLQTAMWRATHRRISAALNTTHSTTRAIELGGVGSQALAPRGAAHAGAGAGDAEEGARVRVVDADVHDRRPTQRRKAQPSSSSSRIPWCCPSSTMV